MSAVPAPRIRFGEFELDLRAGELRRGDERIRLQDQPFQILRILLETPGEVVTREEIRKRLWPDDTIVEFDHSIGTAIKKLRQALGDDADHPRFVETIPRRGFRFVFLDVQFPEVPPTAPTPGLTPDVPPRSTPTRRRIPLAIVAVILLVAIAGWLTWLHAHPSPAAALPQLDLSSANQVTFSNGLDLHPSLSPDGSSVAYSSDQSGHFEIFVRSLASGGSQLQLTNDGQENFEPAWSPDGKQIAYASRKRGGLWLIPALGGAPHLLTDFGSSPVWSPDSTQIAFQSGAIRDISQQAFGTLSPSTIWIIPAAGGKARQLTQDGNPVGGHGHPTWSPDGRYIAFEVFALNTGEVWAARTDGSDLHRIVAEDGIDPVLSPAGRTLYFTERRRSTLRLIRVALTADFKVAGRPEVLKETGRLRDSGLSISADGRTLVYSEQSLADNLWQIPVSLGSGLPTGPPRPLTNDTNWRKGLPSFSPDGSHIAFNAVTAGNGRDLRIVGRDGGEQRLVDTGTGLTGCRGWFPDGHRICVTLFDNGRATLKSVDIDSGRQKDLRSTSGDESGARLSPDGTHLAFTAPKDGSDNIFIAPLGPGPARQLTFDRESASFPFWSPDGKAIAYEITRGPDTFLATIPSSGGTPIQLNTDPGQSWTGGWAPDNDKILFAGMRNGVWNVFSISRRTRKQQQLSNFAKPELYVRYPIWSPRGDQIVFEYGETTGNIWLMHLK